MYKSFLIKYGEIGIKGKNRYLFENALVRQIRYALKRIDGEFEVYKDQARIFVDCSGDYDYDETVDALQHVFGIVGICPMVRLEDKGFETLAEDVVAFMGKTHPEGNYTFKVNARRARKDYPMLSMEVNAALGEKLLKAFPETKVDVHDPEIVVNVEIRDEIYVYSKIIPGPGGMPVGANGKAMLLLSGGIDSPVAAWTMAKRGLRLDAIHFASPPYTSPRAELKVRTLLKKVAAYSGAINLAIVPFTEIQDEIGKNCPEDYFTLIMRRMMMRISERLARNSGSLALITGESLGQVASQTLPALVTTDSVTNMPVLRPLIGMDKEEIIKISRDIDAFETSILPYEDCCTVFTPKHPKTRPTLSACEEAEKGLSVDELIEKAVNGTEFSVIE